MVSFVNFWAGLHKFEGLGRGSFERSWPSLGARGRTFGVDFPGFCRSGVDGSSGGIGFVKFFLDLCRLKWETRGSLGIYGRAWWLRCWRSFRVLYIKVFRRFLWVDFLWNLVRNFRNPRWETAGVVGLVAILVYIVVLTLAALTGGWLRLDLRVRREMVSHHFFVSLHWMSSFIFKLWCRLPWLWMHLNLQNLTLSSINLYIRPSGACIELYKLSLSGWNNTISVEKLCFFFFFFWQIRD